MTLQSAIDAGGGYVGVHCAADLTTISVENGAILERPEPHSELRELIGGHCLRHADEGQFTVRIEADHPVTAGVDDFTAVDAPYRVEHDDDEQVLTRLDHPELDSHPVVWTRSYGDGRVCYCSIGHTAQAFSTPAFGTILRNAVRWVGHCS